MALRDAMDAATIRMHYVSTHDNRADPLTKVMDVSLLLCFFDLQAPSMDLPCADDEEPELVSLSIYIQRASRGL